MPLVKKLPRRLKERDLLIVLDDVSDPALLKDSLIVPLAKNVKYLITTQTKNICDGAALVKMKKPNMQEAMSILGKHIPSLNMTNGDIPLNLEDIAARIVEKADYQPMILAILGREIDEPESWEEVLENFNSLLSTEEKLAISMHQAVGALETKPAAQKLLYLVAMCEPLSVPEVVLQLLFHHMDPSFSFKMNWKILRDRGFIEVNNEDWILSSTYPDFILKNKQEDVSQLLHTLLTPENNDADHELVKALCVLYIECKKNVPFTALAADALEFAATEFKFSMTDRNMIVSMREAVKPLISLLFLSNEGEECDMRRHRLVSEAIKCFISNQDLDDKSFAQLLMEEDIYEDICRVLSNMTQIFEECEPILTKDKTLIMDELRFNLVYSSPDVVITTLTTISELAHAANCDFILAEDRILTTVLKILRSSEDGYHPKMSALTCLSSLAQSSTAREKIASWEGLIEAVVAIFYMQADITQQGSMHVKVLSIQALGHIAHHEMTSAKLVKTPDLLNSIALFLRDIYSKDTKFISALGHSGAIPTIQCLLSLLKGNDRNKDDIIRHRHLMEVITDIFEKYNGDTVYYNNKYTGDEVAQVALQVLTLIDPAKYNSVALYSTDAFIARGHSNAHCGRYMEAFDDYKRADRMDKSNDSFYKTKLCFFKAMVKDYKAALAYGGFALDAKKNDPYLLQEIGVVKELMGDYKGAKIDFDKSLESGPNDYEVLKHRAYVNFMLGCEKEAHEDAKKALKEIPKYRVDKRDSGQAGCLGVLSVPEFLGYDLK